MEDKQIEVLEIGGNAVQWLDIKAIKDKDKLVYLVKDYEVSETDWGKKIVFTIANKYDEFKISNWNLIAKEKFKVDDLIGQEIELTKANKENKVFFKVL